MSMTEETKKMLATWSEKLGLPLEEITKRYNDELAKFKKQTPGKTAEWYERAARSRVYGIVKSRGMIRAKPWDGIFFGYGTTFDVTARQRAQALDVLRTDPGKAHSEGWVNANGEPVDMRKTLASGARNPFYGNVLRETFVRQSIGLARPAAGGPLKLAILQHFRDQALKTPPLGKSVRFLANVRGDEPNRYVLNTSTRTVYEPVTMSEYPTIEPQTIINLLMNAPDDYRSTCAGLMAWHQEHQNDVRRVVIVEGIVVHVRREPIPTTGNYMIFLEDESIMDVTGEGVTVWVHNELADQLDFGSNSRAIVIGRTVVGPGWNRETRQVDNTVQRAMINALGVWVEPEYLVPIEEETVLTGEEGS